jgi:hypothetical protein
MPSLNANSRPQISDQMFDQMFANLPHKCGMLITAATMTGCGGKNEKTVMLDFHLRFRRNPVIFS